MKRSVFALFNLILISYILMSCGHTPQPYTVYENQKVKLTYLVKDNKIFYERTGGVALFGVNPKLKVSCTITNTSESGGVFRLEATLSSQNNSLDFESEKFIPAGETTVLSEEKEINPFTFETNISAKWKIIPPEKEITVPVTKYR